MCPFMSLDYGAFITCWFSGSLYVSNDVIGSHDGIQRCMCFGEYVICWNTGCPASPSSMASFCLKTKASNWRMLKERNIANHWTSFQDLNMDKRYYKSGIIHQMSSCSSRKHRTQTCRERASGRTYKAQCHAGKRIRISTLSAKYDIWLLQLNVLSHNSPREQKVIHHTWFKHSTTSLQSSVTSRIAHDHKSLKKISKNKLPKQKAPSKQCKKWRIEQGNCTLTKHDI